MKDLTLYEASKIIGGRLVGEGELVIRHLLIDSRKIIASHETLFFALEGIRHDGHVFIHDLFQKGIRCFVVNKLPSRKEQYPGAGFILVADTLDALQKIAAYRRNAFKGSVVGITGSNGKTVIKEWISQILSEDKGVVRSPKSFNSQVGVPLSVWLLDNKFDTGLIEAGISEPGEMNRLRKIIAPDIGIFTNIGEPHQENFRDLEHKIREKLILFRDATVIIYCRDHEEIHEGISRHSDLKKQKLFTWAQSGDANLKISSISKGKTHSIIQGSYNGSRYKIRIPFLDDASIENAIHVLSYLILVNYPPDVIISRMQKLEPVGMRLELKRGINNCTLLNDSYNSDLGSLSIALDLLIAQKQNKRKILILSDILQSGRQETDLYSEVADMIHQKKLDRLIGIGNAITRHGHLFRTEKEFYPTTSEFLGQFRRNKFNDEAILVKGARRFAFEKIMNILEQQVHQTRLEINLDALVHNLNFYRMKLDPSTRIMGMVKAFSYGSGSYEIANVLQFHHIDYLVVAFADEGVALREAGITVPIMVMNPEINRFGAMIQFDLEPEIYCFGIFDEFALSIRKSGLMKFPVHIKLDTGMHRLGFMPEEIKKLEDYLRDHPELHVKSIFSHLAASDDGNHDEFSGYQIEQFRTISTRLIEKLGYPVLRHILNSSGIERFPDAQFEMVRLGIGLYGISPSFQDLMMNVTSLKSHISQIKTVKPDQTIGYGREARIDRETRIAIVPVGYADGLDRRFGNGVGQFTIRGKQAPVVGNICMDMCMIDVTGLNAKMGDEVEIFGKHNKVSALAEKIGTIPYEIFTGISERVKRVYFQE